MFNRILTRLQPMERHGPHHSAEAEAFLLMLSPMHRSPAPRASVHRRGAPRRQAALHRTLVSCRSSHVSSLCGNRQVVAMYISILNTIDKTWGLRSGWQGGVGRVPVACG